MEKNCTFRPTTIFRIRLATSIQVKPCPYRQGTKRWKWKY